MQQLKIFVAHGIQDNAVPVQYARAAKLYLEDVVCNDRRFMPAGYFMFHQLELWPMYPMTR